MPPGPPISKVPGAGTRLEVRPMREATPSVEAGGRGPGAEAKGSVRL